MLQGTQGNYTSGNTEVQKTLQNIDAQIQKVKDLKTATDAQKSAEEALAKAKESGSSSADLTALQARVDTTRKLTEATSTAYNTNLIAMQGLQTQYMSSVSAITSQNNNLGSNADAVMSRISASIIGSTDSAKKAEQAMLQFQNALSKDEGFKQKMEAYTKAVQNFKETAKSGGDTTQAVDQVRQAYAGVAKEIERVSQSGDSAKVFDKSSEANQLSTALDQLNNEFLGIKESSKKAANGVDESSQAMQENEEQANATKEANEKLANSMRDMASNHELVGKAIDEMNNGNLSWETMTDLAEKYGDQVLALAGNEEALSPFLLLS